MRSGITNVNDFHHFRLGPGGIDCDADGLRVGDEKTEKLREAKAYIDYMFDAAALVTPCEEPFERANREGMARLHALEAALRPLQS